MRKQVVNIVCIGHSGSTLLGNILGVNSKALHMGEMIAPLKKGLPIICRECVEEPCPIWGGVLKEDVVRKSFESYQSYLSAGRVKRLVIAKRHSGVIYEKLFSGVKDLSVVIDSSKNIRWYNYNAKNKDHEHKYIFLKRDLRGVFANKKRTFGTKIEECVVNYEHDIKRLNKFYSQVAEEDKIVVNYESLVELNHVIKRMCRFIDVDYEEKMNEFNSYKHHLIGGNQANFAQKDPSKTRRVLESLEVSFADDIINYYKSIEGFKLDKRWETELDVQEKNVIEERLNSLFEY